jgi:predicted DNA-binding protein with PD1-like motif
VKLSATDFTDYTERRRPMEYAVGNVGRVIAARLFEGENLYESIEAIAKKENVRCASVLITGGFRRAKVVVGPKEEKPAIVPNYKEYEGAGEVLGVGTIYCDDEGPKLHIHTAIGKGDEVVVGCPRGGASTFLVLEITIIEITGITAERAFDPGSGVKLLKIKNKK